MLNAEQIVEKGVLKLEHSKGKAAQIGYDLSVKEIKRFVTNDDNFVDSQNTFGSVLKDKTILPSYIPVEKSEGWTKESQGWFLEPGYYELTFWEGCKIPNNLVGLIRQRSSILRSGALIHSSVFDPGFETDYMGCFIAVFTSIFIEEDARVAQMYFHECELVSKGYDGQFQKDKQRVL
jgi:deoxycytidine triphosphate deaminase